MYAAPLSSGLRRQRFGMLWAGLAGALSALAFAPFELFPLSFISLAALVAALCRVQRARQGFGLGLAWGLGAFLAGVSWLYVSLNRYGGMPMPLAGLAVGLFCAYLALFPALVGAVFVRVRTKLPSAFAASVLFAALWLLAELLRGRLMTGFPWLAIGYSQTWPSPLAGFFPIVGVYGVGFVVAWLAAWWACARWRRQAFLLGGVSLAVLALGFGLQQVRWTAPIGAPVSVALIQTNIDQALKWAPERLRDILLSHLQQVSEQTADIVVLPETAMPLLLDQLPAGYVDDLTASARARGGDVVFGVFTRDAQNRIFNAAVSAGSAPQQSYAKHHLVPFGEYSPPTFDWFYRFVNIAMSNQTPGPAYQRPLQLAGQQVAVNICYEDLFGHEIIRSLPDASLMLNMSNLAWYGDSWAQPQHLQIARVRAQESGRPMLRATNTGMTAVVAPNGQVEAVLPEFERGALRYEVRGYTGLTPYARWGDWPVMILCAVLLGALGLRRPSRRNIPY